MEPGMTPQSTSGSTRGMPAESIGLKSRLCGLSATSCTVRRAGLASGLSVIHPASLSRLGARQVRRIDWDGYGLAV